MNEQKPPAAIEWTRIKNADGTVRRGYTWNPVAGCSHECQWEMPDGSVAECYAKTVAEKFSQHYPHGFNHAYWHPERLAEPYNMKTPAGIFLDSMSDLMDTAVSDEHIQQVLDAAGAADWHIFQLLTKNAPRLRKFQFPANVWVGVSAPPTWYKGHRLTDEQQRRYVFKALDVLREIRAKVRWMSIEPLSFDMAAVFDDWSDENEIFDMGETVGAPMPLEWMVIGAASNGPKLYQPKPEWVNRLLGLADNHAKQFAPHPIPVFFKGNLDWPRDQWREDFPQITTTP